MVEWLKFVCFASVFCSLGVCCCLLVLLSSVPQHFECLRVATYHSTAVLFEFYVFNSSSLVSFSVCITFRYSYRLVAICLLVSNTVSSFDVRCL